MNPLVIEMMLREKREDMLREAERQRMLAEYEKGQQQLIQKLVLLLGDVLIRLGERMKRRYEQELALQAEACCEKTLCK